MTWTARTIAARQADHYQCGSDSDCAQRGGNGDHAPAAPHHII